MITRLTVYNLVNIFTHYDMDMFSKSEYVRTVWQASLILKWFCFLNRYFSSLIFPSYSAQANCTDFLLVLKQVKFAFPVEGMFFPWLFIFQDGSLWLVFLFIFNNIHHLCKQVSLPNQTLTPFYEIIYPSLAFKVHPKYFIKVDTHVSGRMNLLPRKITIKKLLRIDVLVGLLDTSGPLIHNLQKPLLCGKILS